MIMQTILFNNFFSPYIEKLSTLHDIPINQPINPSTDVLFLHIFSSVQFNT